MEPIKLDDKIRIGLNQHLKNLQIAMDDLQKAKQAGIQGVEEQIALCQDCQSDIAKLKQVYFPNKR